eukprot:scaffold394074_cov23-Prasinocladus_malaysianus.AAC.1
MALSFSCGEKRGLCRPARGILGAQQAAHHCVRDSMVGRLQCSAAGSNAWMTGFACGQLLRPSSLPAATREALRVHII